MKILNKITKFIVLLLIVTMQFVFILPIPKAYADATSPNLGNAASFSILAGLSTSAAGAVTTISGNLGLSPGLAVSRTGPWTMGGSEYFGTGGLSQNAQADALSAFNNLAGQSSNGGWGTSPWSPVPGVWTVASDTSFTGTVTLSGDYDDVWVFQVGRDMTFSGTVSLTGNAQACHVFWQIGRDTTIASGSSFVGTLIASRDVTLVSGATVNGRIISLNSSITTDGNTISGPSCASSPTATPTPTSTSDSTLSSGSGGSSSTNGEKFCPMLNYISPTIIESRRINENSISLNWGPYSGINTFIVQYGLENGKWIYSTNVTGFSTTLNALPSNQPIWVRIGVSDNCSLGNFGESKLIGGPSLPNTGLAPHQDKIPWHIQVGISAGILVSLILIQRKYRFSSKHETSR